MGGHRCVNSPLKKHKNDELGGCGGHLRRARRRSNVLAILIPNIVFFLKAKNIP